MGFRGETAVAGFGSAARRTGKVTVEKPSRKTQQPGKPQRHDRTRQVEPGSKPVAGRFILLRKLAEGGMGTVYVARQTSVNREVAVKILNPDKQRDPEARERFRSEAAAVSRLRNPHTVTLIDFGEDDRGSLFLAMELLEGCPLSTYMERHGPQDSGFVVRVMDQVLDSLSEAHGAGILHRDLKPENIFLVETESGEPFVKVLDFGVAKVMNGPKKAGTVPGKVYGTPYYMSPEQIMNKPLDARSDLYSLAVVMFEMLTGELPYKGASPLEIGVRKVRDLPPRLEDFGTHRAYPPAASRFFARALFPEPDNRPRNDKEFRELMHTAFVARGTRGAVDTGQLAVPNQKITGRMRAVSDADTPTVVAAADRRRSRRTPKLVSVRCYYNGDVSAVTESDVSANGGFINSRLLPIVGHKVILGFRNPETGEFNIQVLAEVTRLSSGDGGGASIRGFGVRWVKLRGAGEYSPIVRFARKMFGVELPEEIPAEAHPQHWEYLFAENRVV